MSSDPYVYRGTNVLRNKAGMRDPAELDRFERRMTRQRGSEPLPTGDFDLDHLRAIHRHLFQDVYEWAGKIRTVEISKGGDQFMFRQYIANGMADVHRRIVAADYFSNTTAGGFATEAGKIIGDVNYVHPFREGNGRTQLLYLQQLAARAGHALDLRHLAGPRWIEASKQANKADYEGMSSAIAEALEKSNGN